MKCQVLSDRNVRVMQTEGDKISVGADDRAEFSAMAATAHNHSDVFLHDRSLEENRELDAQEHAVCVFGLKRQIIFS